MVSMLSFPKIKNKKINTFNTVDLEKNIIVSAFLFSIFYYQDLHKNRIDSNTLLNTRFMECQFSQNNSNIVKVILFDL